MAKRNIQDIEIMETELRIGNYILEDETIYSHGINKTERKLELSDFRVSDDNWSDHWDMIKPIPLTKEHLIKFGYSFQPWGCVKEESPLIRFSLSPKEKYWVELGNGFRIELPYVHTLQNFMSLTGEELKINGKA